MMNCLIFVLIKHYPNYYQYYQAMYYMVLFVFQLVHMSVHRVYIHSLLFYTQLNLTTYLPALCFFPIANTQPQLQIA